LISYNLFARLFNKINFWHYAPGSLILATKWFLSLNSRKVITLKTKFKLMAVNLQKVGRKIAINISAT